MEKKVYFVLGAKWFDKVNGNTYCNAKVFDSNGDVLFYAGYQYGYNNYYLTAAKNEIESKLNLTKDDIKLVDLGSLKLTKKEIKNNLF